MSNFKTEKCRHCIDIYSTQCCIGIILLGDYMPISDKNIRIAVTIPRTVNEKLKILASKQGRSVSGFIAIMIIKFVEKNLPEEK